MDRRTYLFGWERQPSAFVRTHRAQDTLGPRRHLWTGLGNSTPALALAARCPQKGTLECGGCYVNPWYFLLHFFVNLKLLKKNPETKSFN